MTYPSSIFSKDNSMPWNKDKIRVMRSERQAQGLCTHCGEPRDENGTTQKCRSCADKARDRSAKSRKKAGPKRQLFICVNGKCVTCGRNSPQSQEYGPCEPCYFRLMASMYLGSRKRWREMERLWIAQGGICPYTGLKLELGVDASLDHILPSSRFPDLAQEIDNMEFVHYRVNEMKRDMTKEEFIEFLQMMNLHLFGEAIEQSPWAESLQIGYDD